LKYIVKFKFPIKMSKEELTEALFECVINGCEKTIDYIIKNLNPDFINNSNEFILTYALDGSSVSTFKLLLSYKAIDPCYNEYEVLKKASSSGDQRMVILLLNDSRVKPSVDIINECIDYAGMWCFNDVIRLLKSYLKTL